MFLAHKARLGDRKQKRVTEIPNFIHWWGGEERKSNLDLNEENISNVPNQTRTTA